MCKQLKYIPKLRNIVVVLSLYSVEVQVVNPRITRRNVTKWACIHTITVKISVYTEWSTSKPFVSVARQHALAYTARYCYIVFTVCPTRWGIVPIDECTYRRNLSTTRCAIIPVFHPHTAVTIAADLRLYARRHMLGGAYFTVSRAPFQPKILGPYICPYSLA